MTYCLGHRVRRQGIDKLWVTYDIEHQRFDEAFRFSGTAGRGTGDDAPVTATGSNPRSGEHRQLRRQRTGRSVRRFGRPHEGLGRGRMLASTIALL